MKKQFSVFVLLALIVATVFAPVANAATEDMVVAYISAPADWDNPCVWAWDDSGKNAFAAWPGGQTEKDPANEGWYYIYLPVWANNVIVNANEGTVQTSDFKLDEKNVWITVESPESWDVSYEAKTSGEAPAYVEKIAIHARVPQAWENVNLWAWLHPDGTNAFAAWPGEQMKAGDGGWFTAQAPAWINSVIVNGGAEGIQTTDLTVEPKEMWVVVKDDLSAEVFYENPDLAGDNITVRVKVSSDWAEPCLWAWLDPDGTNAFAAWPGEPLKADGDWYSLEVPGWINSVIVNANGGTVQTGDTKGLETGKDLWILVNSAEDYTVAYEEITAAPPPIPESSSAQPPTPQPVPELEPEPAPANSGNTVMWIILSAIVVAGCAIGVVVVRKNKK